MKVFHGSDDIDVEQAIYEATLHASLRHRNIIRCYGLCYTEEGYPVIVMDLGVDSLCNYCKEQRRRKDENRGHPSERHSPPNAILRRQGLQLCSAVKYLRDLGISHGDIKVSTRSRLLTHS